MSENFKSRLKHIDTLIFDIDGVMTDGKFYFMPDGTPIRGQNIKDSYALQLAVKKGYRLAVISGGSSEVVKKSLQHLGIEYVFLKQHDKLLHNTSSLFPNHPQLLLSKHKLIGYLKDLFAAVSCCLSKLLQWLGIHRLPGH